MSWEEKAVLSIAFKRLARRPLTVMQLREIFDKREVPLELQDSAIKKLIEMKLLNDFEYACAFIRTRNLIKPKPKKVLALELSRKGIDTETVQKALKEIGVDEVAAAKNLYEKNKWRWESLEAAVSKRKAQEFLARKGFGWDVVKSIVGVGV